MGGDSKQINKHNFIVAKYSEDNKQNDVNNGRSAE